MKICRRLGSTSPPRDGARGSKGWPMSLVVATETRLSTDSPAAYIPATRLPMLVPTSMSTGMPASAKALRRPMWLKPRAEPPPSTRATVGRSPSAPAAAAAPPPMRRMGRRIRARTRARGSQGRVGAKAAVAAIAAITTPYTYTRHRNFHAAGGLGHGSPCPPRVCFLLYMVVVHRGPGPGGAGASPWPGPGPGRAERGPAFYDTGAPPTWPPFPAWTAAFLLWRWLPAGDPVGCLWSW